MEMADARIRMLVIDIDGTLLNPEGYITAPSLAAVRAAQQAGIVVTLSSHTTGVTATAGGSDGVSAVLRNQVTGWQGTVADEDIISGARGVQNATMNLSGWAAWTGCAATFRTGG